MKPRTTRLLAAAGAALLAAAPAAGYEILLDIDEDGDPATVNAISYATTVTVRIILQPSTPGEIVTGIEFGLGGSCRECDGVHEYGTGHDLADHPGGDWPDHPDLTGSWNGILLLGCPAPTGYHELYSAVAAGEGLVLDGPVFIATFTAWKRDQAGEPCPLPPANLAAFEVGGTWWNYVQIGGTALGVQDGTFGRLKATFR